MGSTGAHVGTGAGQYDARTEAAGFYRGLAVCTLAENGLMYSASVRAPYYTPRILI